MDHELDGAVPALGAAETNAAFSLRRTGPFTGTGGGADAREHPFRMELLEETRS